MYNMQIRRHPASRVLPRMLDAVQGVIDVVRSVVRGVLRMCVPSRKSWVSDIIITHKPEPALAMDGLACRFDG